MKIRLQLTLLLVFLVMRINAQDNALTHLASYSLNEEGHAETVAYDVLNKQAYFTSSTNNSFFIIDISDPANPTLVKEVSLAEYGAGPNSIDTYEFPEGARIAVAVEADVKQESGKVVLFDSDGQFINAWPVGALPDMLSFSPDGKYLVVACEGEPNADYSVDPIGSVTIGNTETIQLSTVTFEAWNDKKASLINKGVRIYGNEGTASVAQDLEPEYVTFSDDSKLAYVNCQENNALVVIDLETAEVLDILPLGYKNHSKGTPSIELYNVNELVNDWPALGTPTYDGGQPEVMLGGFSGLYYNEKESDDSKSVFYVIPDRGPNDSPVKKANVEPAVSQNLRPFKLPNYQGRIVKFTLDHNSKSITLDEQIMLTRKDGVTPISGRGNIPGFDEVPVIYAHSASSVLFEDDFSSENLDKWSTVSLSSDKNWEVRDYEDNFYAQMNGFGADEASDDFLVLGPVKASSSTVLSFTTAKNYDGGALDVLVSSDYDGGNDPLSFTWENLNDKAAFSEGDWNTVASGDIDLSSYAGENIYVVFRYTSTGTGAGEAAAWQVDNVKVTSGADYSEVDYTSAGKEYHVLPYDEMGGDFEGILIDKRGNFWMCDEYRPAIYNVDPEGKLIERYVADGTSKLGDTEVAEGTYGSETLPAVYAKRRANRGFEAIAYDEEADVIYTFIQSPMYNPSSSTKNKSDVIRILGINALNGEPVAEYVYLLERNKNSGFAASRVDKIGDAVYTGNGRFLVIERDSEGPDNPSGKKYVFEIDITSATNILDMEIASTTESPTLEEMSADDLAEANIQAVFKHKVVNLPSIGYVSSDKAEGVALLPDGNIAVMNDNDFGLAGAGITDNSVLGIISFADDYSFDASNKDDKIDIKNHPTYGMFQPDAIASYTVDSMTYIVTANEGDSRDYDGYSEEERVKDLTLDPTQFPDAAALQESDNLGRLKTTTANGDLDGDGDFDRIFSYGARSFSIFDQYGNLVYDSANEFANIVADEEPELFNEDEGEFDNRSDDKGVEPEAIAVGQIEDETYAFIGLERQSSILVYNITNPWKPYFVEFYTNRTVDGENISGDVSPEIIKFIPADQSPNGENMLLVGYEVSGSMSLISIDKAISSVSEELEDSDFYIYPNPIVKLNHINLSEELSGAIFDDQGRVVLQFNDVKTIDISILNQGIYTVKTESNGSKRFVKL